MSFTFLLCLSIFYNKSFQCYAQASAAAVGLAKSFPTHCVAWLQFMRCSIVWGSPHAQLAHASEVKFHFFMEALHLPSPMLSQFSVF